MRIRVKVSPQVEAYVKSLAPHPRRALSRAIKGLAQNRGDVKQLESHLEGYSRLRVGSHRVIFAARAEAGECIVDCLFAERRAVIYEMFAEQVRRQMEADVPDQ